MIAPPDDAQGLSIYDEMPASKSRMTLAKERLNEKLSNTRKNRSAKAMKLALRTVMANPHLRERMLADVDRRKFYAAREEELNNG